MKKFMFLFAFFVLAAPAMAQEVTSLPSDAEILRLIGELEGKMTSIEGRTNNVTKAVEELQGILTTELEKQQEHLRAIEQLRTHQASLNERALAIKTEADKLAVTADRQAQQIAELNGQVGGLQNQAQQLQGQAAEARQQAAANYQMALQASAQAQQALNGANAADRAARPNFAGRVIAFFIPGLRHR